MEKGKRAKAFAILVFWVLLLGFSANWFPWLRGYKPWPPEWRWFYVPGKAPFAAAVLVALGLAGMWGVLAVSRRLGGRVRRSVLAGILIGLFVLLGGFQYSATSTRNVRLTFLFSQRTYVEWINGFYLASLKVDSPGDAFRHFDKVFLETKFARVVTHPPGFISYYAGMREILRAMGWGKGDVAGLRKAIEPLEAAHELAPLALVTMVIAAFLQPLLANLAIIPLFDLLRRQWSPRVALRVLFFYALIPGVVLFVPSPDEFFLPLTAVALWGFCLGCDTRLLPWEGTKAEMEQSGDVSPGNRARNEGGSSFGLLPRKVYLAIAGLAVAIHSLFGYHFILLVGLFGLWRVLLSWRDLAMGFRLGRAVERAASDLAVLFAPIAVVWLLLWVVLDYNYITYWLVGVGIHRHGVTAYRLYWPWLAWNLWDIAFFTGLPLLAAIGWAVRRRGVALSPYVISLAAIILAMDFTGTVRGEAARILIPLYPLLVPLAAPFFANEDAAPGRFRLLAFHQIIQVACMALYLNLF